MTTVKILHGNVGEWKEGDIVPDAPPGLVSIAEKGTVNAATLVRVAEIIDDISSEFDDLKSRARDLKISGYGRMGYKKLKEAVDAAEVAQMSQSTELQPPDQTTGNGSTNGDQNDPNASGGAGDSEKGAVDDNASGQQ